MSGRAPQPAAEEIRRVALHLAAYWPGARKALKRYLDGGAPWEGALRHVRVLLREVGTDLNRGHKIPLHLRPELMDFATRYGTDTRGFLYSEPLTLRKNIRFGDSGWAAIEAAAKVAGVTPIEFVRDAALLAAQKGTTE